jgi:CYTH domain-containing protein
MGAEIERKFRVLSDAWRDGSPGVRISQGYLSQDPDRTVRVRIAGESGWLTIKGRSRGIARAEFEYEIPLADALELLSLCLPSVIDKTRHLVPHGAHVWEVDVFHGENAGLIIAEVELENESISPEIPPWVGEEVSADPRYFNSCLAAAPFKKWS